VRAFIQTAAQIGAEKVFVFRSGQRGNFKQLPPFGKLGAQVFLQAKLGADGVSRGGMCLAQFKLGNLEEALSLFEAALESAGDNILVKGQVTVLLAQTMWAIGTDGFKESAKAQLLEWSTFPLLPI